MLFADGEFFEDEVGAGMFPVVYLDEGGMEFTFDAVEPLLLELVTVPASDDIGAGVSDKVEALDFVVEAESVQRADGAAFVEVDFTVYEDNTIFIHLINLSLINNNYCAIRD